MPRTPIYQELSQIAPGAIDDEKISMLAKKFKVSA
jgi:hypothetical protein